MANSTYDRIWQEAMSELNEQVHIEDHTLAEDDQDAIENSTPRQATILEAFEHYASLYIKYIQILRRLSECYDQMVHPQKRIDVKSVLEVVATRVVELKHNLVKWNPPNPDVATSPERSFPWEYVNLDAILVDLKLPPETLEIPVSKCFQEADMTQVAARDRLVQGYMKLKHGYDVMYIDALDKDTTFKENMSVDDAIAIIQRSERGRQGRERGLLVAELREEEKNRKIYEAAQSSDMDPDIAASNIQRIFRGYSSRARAQKERDEELVFIGMRFPITDRSNIDKKLADTKLRRCMEQVENKEEYEKALIDLHDVVLTEEGPLLKEYMLEERRKWITDILATGQLPEDLSGFYAAKLAENGLNLLETSVEAQPKTSSDGGAKKKEGKDKASKKGGGDKKKDKKGKYKKDKDDVVEVAPEKPPPLSKPSELCRNLAKSVQAYEKVWLEQKDADSFYQKYDVSLAKAVVRNPVEVRVRQQVDEMLVLQLMNVKAQVEAAANKKKGKKAKGGKKGKKKGGKKEKGKKGKGLPGDKIPVLKGRPPESFLSVLIEQNIVQMPHVPASMEDYVGAFNLLGTVFANSERRDRYGNFVPQDPSSAQLRQILTEYAILPLSSDFIRSKTPLVKSIMLYGPKASGKTMLVNIIAAVSGSMILNISPANLVGKFPGKTGPTTLVHMVFSLAKVAAYQPIIIYIDECEQIFAGGSTGGKKKKSAASVDSASRFKKDLLTYIKAANALELTDRVLVIGVTKDPASGDTKDYRAFFNKFLHVPYPDYASRILLWRTTILKTIEKQVQYLNHVNSTVYPIQARAVMTASDMDISTLAHISEGYSSGSIVQAVKGTLTFRRIECLPHRKLHSDEFLTALARQTVTFVEDYEKFKGFTAQITGLKETREKIRKAKEENVPTKDEGKGKKKK